MALSLKKVLISDEVDPQCVEILRQNGVDAVLNTKLSKEQLLAEIPQYDGLIVRSATKVTADVLDAATNLKIIGRAGTGVDNIDTPAATKKGIIVMNTPGGNTMSAAELTCIMVLATSRHISQGTESLKAGRWDRKKFMGNEVYGKTLAIIGLGRIGKEVATRMQSFGMTTIGFDPIIPGSVSAEFDVEWMEMEKLWPLADYITVHTPLIPQTKNMINDDVFAKCKKGVRIINCARGGIVDEDALLRALESGQCGGAGLDVFLEEPPKNTALIQHRLVTSTPHLGASTTEAQSRVAKEIAEQFIDVVNGKSLFGAINAHALHNALSPSTKPWVALGSALGTIGATLGGQISSQSKIKILTEGSAMNKAGSYLGAAALVGLLQSVSQGGLNLVSAPALAKDMGVQVAAEHKDAPSNGFPESVTLELTQADGTSISLTGTVGSGHPQLVAVNKRCLSQGFTLQGPVLLYRSSADVLATVAGALSDSSIVSYATSSPSNAENWSLMGISKALSDLTSLKSKVPDIYQIAL